MEGQRPIALASSKVFVLRASGPEKRTGFAKCKREGMRWKWNGKKRACFPSWAFHLPSRTSCFAIGRRSVGSVGSFASSWGVCPFVRLGRPAHSYGRWAPLHTSHIFYPLPRPHPHPHPPPPSPSPSSIVFYCILLYFTLFSLYAASRNLASFIVIHSTSSVGMYLCIHVFIMCICAVFGMVLYVSFCVILL